MKKLIIMAVLAIAIVACSSKGGRKNNLLTNGNFSRIQRGRGLRILRQRNARQQARAKHQCDMDCDPSHYRLPSRCLNSRISGCT